MDSKIIVQRFSGVKITEGTFKGFDGKRDVPFSAEFPRFLIHEAWNRGCDFEKEADGYGKGLGTMGDWSGIRDSSDEAINKMFEKSLNFFFGT